MKPTNKPMKRLSLYLFLILFTLQTPSQADDIRDFEIEGMSIGDSLLDYFSEEEIKKEKQDESPYKNNDFFLAVFDSKNFNSGTYDFFRFHLRSDDNTYRIFHIGGLITYRNKDFKECTTKKNEISKELVQLFGDDKKQEGKLKKYVMDKTGKSTSLSTYFNLNDGRIRVMCLNMSEELENKKRWYDNLSVNIYSNEFSRWLKDKAYK